MLTDEVKSVYDKQCPACSQYCEWAKAAAIQRAQVVLVDARAPSELMDEITRCGLDIDEGMVLQVDGRIYYGAQAIHQLALHDGFLGWFGVINRALFRHARVALVLYPVMRWVRNALLKILGVRRINNLSVPGRERF